MPMDRSTLTISGYKAPPEGSGSRHPHPEPGFPSTVRRSPSPEALCTQARQVHPGQRLQNPVLRLSAGGLGGNFRRQSQAVHRYTPSPDAAKSPNGDSEPARAELKQSRISVARRRRRQKPRGSGETDHAQMRSLKRLVMVRVRRGDPARFMKLTSCFCASNGLKTLLKFISGPAPGTPCTDSRRPPEQRGRS